RAAVSPRLQLDLRPLGQLADNVVEHVRRHGGGTRLLHLGVQRLDDLDVEIGGLQLEPVLAGADQHVRQNRNGITALHHAVNVGEGPYELAPLDRDLHGEIRMTIRKTLAPGQRQGKTLAAWPEIRKGAGQKNRYSCSIRFRFSISSANALSPDTSPSILRTAWSTVV